MKLLDIAVPPIYLIYFCWHFNQLWQKDTAFLPLYSFYLFYNFKLLYLGHWGKEKPSLHYLANVIPVARGSKLSGIGWGKSEIFNWPLDYPTHTSRACSLNLVPSSPKIKTEWVLESRLPYRRLNCSFPSSKNWRLSAKPFLVFLWWWVLVKSN